MRVRGEASKVSVSARAARRAASSQLRCSSRLIRKGARVAAVPHIRVSEARAKGEGNEKVSGGLAGSFGAARRSRGAARTTSAGRASASLLGTARNTVPVLAELGHDGVLVEGGLVLVHERHHLGLLNPVLAEGLAARAADEEAAGEHAVEGDGRRARQQVAVLGEQLGQVRGGGGHFVAAGAKAAGRRG